MDEWGTEMGESSGKREGREDGIMRKRVSLDWIFDNMCRLSRDISYEQQYQRILDLISEGRIVPLKASGTNGKHPALYREYWLIVPVTISISPLLNLIFILPFLLIIICHILRIMSRNGHGS